MFSRNKKSQHLELNLMKNQRKKLGEKVIREERESDGKT